MIWSPVCLFCQIIEWSHVISLCTKPPIWVWEMVTLMSLLYRFLSRVHILFNIADGVDGLVQDCSNSTANALELLQSCIKPSMCAKYISGRCHCLGLFSMHGSRSCVQGFNQCDACSVVIIWCVDPVAWDNIKKTVCVIINNEPNGQNRAYLCMSL